MKCPVCSMEIKEWNKTIRGHLVCSIDHDGHVHTHGNLEETNLMQELVDEIVTVTHTKKIDQILKLKEVVFHNRQRIGDALMFTCGIRDFKKQFPDVRVGVNSIAGHIWDYNPYVDKRLKETKENLVKIGPQRITNASNHQGWHFANGYRWSMEQALGVHIEQGLSRPDIWMTEEEYHSERLFKEPYWLICIGGEKGWGCKMYPFDRFQEFVSQNPDTLFVQIGSREDDHPRLRGSNVIDYIGKTQDRETGIRDLFKLFLNAEGSIGLVSFHMHLSGALWKPAIIIGGAREPVSFVRYPGHQFLATDGCLPCAITACWKCDINGCRSLVEGKEKIPKCVDIIQPKDLTRALELFYTGGRLKKGVVSPKPKEFKNIVKTPPKPKRVNVKEVYNMDWGGGCITDRDWEFMQEILIENKVKTILEFGCGLSSLLMKDSGLSITSYETVPAWIEKIKAVNKDLDIRLWNGKEEIAELKGKKFDLAFVDGPAGGGNREISTRMASECANVVIVHDAGREFEKKWQDIYLQGKFYGPLKGGHRCHAWVANSTKQANCILTTNIKPDDCIVKTTDVGCQVPALTTKQKYVKVVSTARGWGGCARSVTTILKFLLNQGHKVEFIPFRNAIGSHEFNQYIKDYLHGLMITDNYNTLSESCDVLFVYADDMIWDFDKQELVDAFSNLNADKKIMMLNYRRGRVGEIPWTRGWNKYMFLNSTQEKELLRVHPGVKTKVLPPCTELNNFLVVKPNYNNNVRLVRHSSQGDTKFAKDFMVEISNMLSHRSDMEVHLLPGPSFVHSDERNVFKHPRTDRVNEISKFLSIGNVFWYSLPQGYMDMGPRVILEAMAAGLPVIADNWGGAPDRVTKECGWLCNTKQEHYEVVKNLTFEEIKRKGEASKQRAIDEFIPDKWIKEIVDA